MCVCDIIQSSNFGIGNNSKEKIYKKRILNLNISGKELNVNEIHGANNLKNNNN